MAVTMTALTGATDNSNQSSYTTASISPTGDRLVIAAVLNRVGGGGTTPTLSGNGLTWVQVATVEFETVASPKSRVTLFRAMGSSPSSGAVTIDFGGVDQGGCQWSIVEFDGVDTGGTDGSAAVVQSATNNVDGSASALTVTLSAFGNANNATYGVFAANIAGSFTPGSGFTEIHDVNDNFPPLTLQSEWRNDNDTSVDATPSASADMGAIAIEIKAASSDVIVTPSRQNAAWALNSPTVVIPTSFTATLKNLTWATLPATAGISVVVQPVRQNATWAVLSPTIQAGVLVQPSRQNAAWALNSPTVVIPASFTATRQNATWATLPATAGASATIQAARQNATWALLTPRAVTPGSVGELTPTEGKWATLAVQVYAGRGGPLLADFSHKAKGLTLSTGPHGFQACEFEVELTLEEAFEVYDWPGTPWLMLSDGGSDIVWEGRLEDRSIIESGIQLLALGAWRAMNDAPYTAMWSDSIVENWRPFTADDLSGLDTEKFSTDTNTRLFITLTKNTAYTTGDRGTIGYYAPDDGETDIVEVEFTYAFNMSSDWTARLLSWQNGFANETVEWSLVGNGSLQTGSVTQTLSNSSAQIIGFEVTNTAGVTNSAETGALYFKLTSVRVKAKTGSVYADHIADDLVAFINGINGDQLSSNTKLIESPGEDLRDEIYEDMMPAEILGQLAGLHNYETGVWEEQKLHFRSKGSAGRTWYVDVIKISELQRSLENLVNSAYAVYQDTDNRTLRTAVANDIASQDRWGIIRRGQIGVRTTDAPQAQTHRDAFLSDRSDFVIRAKIEFEHVYNEAGAEQPLWVIRSGDTLIMRNLPPTLSPVIDNIRSFRVGETEYSVDDDEIDVAPEELTPTLVTLVARREKGL